MSRYRRSGSFEAYDLGGSDLLDLLLKCDPEHIKPSFPRAVDANGPRKSLAYSSHALERMRP